MTGEQIIEGLQIERDANLRRVRMYQDSDEDIRDYWQKKVDVIDAAIQYILNDLECKKSIGADGQLCRLSACGDG